jgi:hypothetical protein
MRSRTDRWGSPWWALAFLLLGAGIFVGHRVVEARRPPPNTATWENYQRVRVGMTRQEVEDILGKTDWIWHTAGARHPQIGCCWQGVDHRIIIGFDLFNGTVQDKFWE